MMRYWIGYAAIVVVTVASVDAQQVYRWTDKQGRVHYSNVGPSGDVAPAAPDEAVRPRGESPAETAARVEEKKEEKANAYSSVTEDTFSAVASRRRGELKSDLDDAKKQLRAIEREMESLRRTREETFDQYGAQLQGVTRPEPKLSDREKELVDEKKKVEERIKAIHASYDEVREETEKRHGGLPGWWRPLD